MLYKQNSTPYLSDELFKNPTNEYRAAPFWAWNCKLNKDVLNRQIEYLKEMGFGGFHMHSRSGMATKYLSEEFMGLIKSCVDKAKKEDMLAWLYDEDRWPSGSAGGYVTKDPRYRGKYLLFTLNKLTDSVLPQEGYLTGKPYLVACFDVLLNTDGTLRTYKKINEDFAASGNKWYVYLCALEDNGWHNGQAYVDTLCCDAIRRFIDITHETYKNCVGDEFDKTVPAIFTDEPHFVIKDILSFANAKEDINIPWTTDFANTFNETYGIDIVDSLPEILWDLPNNEVSLIRYYYHEHTCNRFTEAFAEQYGNWCKQNNIKLTGHLSEETTLRTQTCVVGDVMRSLRYFDLPGIDILVNSIEFSTAKQAQSICNQYGKEGVMSELYGVTNWDFDFRGHKFQGDWQAALGVTVRAPHLSWVSMKGSAKRDYPASIGYQSPWYKEYSYVEDHFARLATALSRGKPKVSVGIIHPIESFWLHYGPNESTKDVGDQMEDNFQNIISWLLFGLVDFDFINEALLPEICGKVSKTLKVGQMEYSTIIVPGCETLRRSTFEILKEFQKQGGKLIFVGNCPKYIDAKPSEEIKDLFEISQKSQFSKAELLAKLQAERIIEIINVSETKTDDNGTKTDNLIYSLRCDGEVKWLFIAHGKEPDFKDVVPPQSVLINIKGEYTPVLYDTVLGEILDIQYKIENGVTSIPHIFHGYDSLLLKLCPNTNAVSTICSNRKEMEIIKKIDFKDKVEYTREEDNVYLLDMARYSLNGQPLCELEEILRIDKKCREQLGFIMADGFDVQPWAIDEEETTNHVDLHFDIYSESEVSNVFFAFEGAEEIIFNDEKVEINPIGYFVDEAILKIRMPNIKRGNNILKIKMPISNRISLESCYLLGDFDVRVDGCQKTITKPSDKIAFGSISTKGMPFYGGNVIYKTEIDTPACNMLIKASNYRGSLISVLVDGVFAGRIVYPPYEIVVENLKEGKHTIELLCYGNRANTFGPLHNCSNDKWIGPSTWYKKDESWSYQYKLFETGILKSPEITLYKY